MRHSFGRRVSAGVAYLPQETVTAGSLRSVIVCVAVAAYCIDSVNGSVALAIEQSPEATVGR